MNGMSSVTYLINRSEKKIKTHFTLSHLTAVNQKDTGNVIRAV